ncbi:MAG: hypothetical protein IT262_21060 [Saprospiraceae bacterium]|nr:hypothetical protein [Saprospiraceae bacterium]
MKNAVFFFATVITLLFASSATLCAQKTATWKGGTPGRPNEWNCPTNWKEGRVPNEFSQVLIPDVSSSTFHNPVLKEGKVEIWSLQILSGASLRIGKYAGLILLEQDEQPYLAFGEGVLQQGTMEDTLIFLATR